MGKNSGYAIGGFQIVLGALALIIPGLQAFALPLFISGASTIIGTALTPTPPREKTLRDSPTYGIDRFDNPRGPEASVPILYGEHLVKPVVIAESVTEAIEGVSPGDVRNTSRQEFRWLGIIGEGPIESVTEIRINDRDVVSEVLDQEIAKGNGTKKEFPFPRRWIYLGDDEAPAVEVFVDAVRKSWATQSTSVEFTVPEKPARTYDPNTGLPLPIPRLAFVVKLDNRSDRILSTTVRVFVRGTGYPEAEQPRLSGIFRWSAQKLDSRRVKVTFATRPPTGYTVRVAYDYLAAEGFAITQDSKGQTKAVFGTAPGNGKKITAKFRTTSFHGLRVGFRPGTLDQQPLEGFTDLEQSRNPKEQILTLNDPIEETTSGREVDDLRIGFSAPRGLIEWKEDGGTEAVKVKVRIEYRKAGASSWTTLRSPSGTSFELVGERSSTMRWDVSIRDELTKRAIAGETDAVDALEAFARAAYEVRVTRLTGGSSDPLVSDELNFQYVTEVLHEGYCYPGTSLLGLRGIPGGFLAGGSLRVSCRARRAKLYDPRTDDHGGARDLGSPQNPALAIRDLVTSAEGTAVERYGGGAFFLAQDFFLGADGNPAERNGLIDFADWCDEWVHRPGDDATRAAGPTNGERRCRLNAVLDTPSSLMEAVGDMAFLGYCFASLQGVKWRFPLDRDGDPVFTFVDEIDPVGQNMSNFVLKLDEWIKSPTAVKGTFWNEVIEFERDELLYPVEGMGEGAALNIREVDLRGCTRETEASRMLRHLAEQAREMPFPCSWEAHPGVQHVEAGDVVAIRTRVPYSTGASATELKVRVLASIVARDEAGKVTVRYAGRVIRSNTYSFQTVTVRQNARRPTGAPTSKDNLRRVTLLRARVT